MSRPSKIHEPLGVSFDAALGIIANEQKPEVESFPTKPFLKWAGGKRSIMGELMPRMPSQYRTYHEPFLGGGALFFSAQPTKASLSDVNLPLVLTFIAVRDDLDKLISLLKMHERLHTEEYYLRARERFATEEDATKVASLLIYLNKTCFNGLYRVNSSGKFNVPIGDYKECSIFEEDVLRNDSKLLQGVEIDKRDFSQCSVARDDFFYLDPPYHKTFAGYAAGGFGDEQHRELAKFCHEIHDAGAFFMLSNSDTPFVRSLYSGFLLEQVSASRSVSCKANQRGRENELLIRNYKSGA